MHACDVWCARVRVVCGVRACVWCVVCAVRCVCVWCVRADGVCACMRCVVRACGVCVHVLNSPTGST